MDVSSVDVLRYIGPDAVLAALEENDAQLVSMNWLISHAAHPQAHLPRRQDLPAEALVTAEQMRSWIDAAPAHVTAKALPLVSVSYCWLSPTNPDPTNEQLAAVASLLSRERGQYQEFFPDMAVFMDWCSLFQEHGGVPRTPEQYASFRRALEGSMDLWYGHSGAVVLLLTELPARYASSVRAYKDRGWTFFERCCAELIKPDRVYIVPEGKYYGDEDAKYLWRMCVDVGGAMRQLPRAPEQFAAELATKTFTNNADCASVVQLYTSLATSLIGAAKVLDLDDVAFGEGDGLALAAAISLNKNIDEISLCHSFKSSEIYVDFLGGLPDRALHRLRKLFLQECGLEDAGAAALSRAICSGAMPALEIFILADNPITEPGAKSLANAISSGRIPCLSVLNIDKAAIGTKGAVLIANALATGATPALTELGVGELRMGDEGAHAFLHAFDAGATPRINILLFDENGLTDAAALHLATTVRNGALREIITLSLGKNRLTEVGVVALAAAFSAETVPTLAELSVDDNPALGDGAIRAIVEAIRAKRIPSINNLDFDETDMKRAGAIALSFAISAESLSSLEQLSLSSNDEIEDAGVMAVAIAIDTVGLPALTVLDVQGLAMDDEGCAAIAKAMANCRLPVLRKLIMTNNSIGPDGAIALAAALQSGNVRKLELLDLEANSVESRGVAALARALFASGATPAFRELNLKDNDIDELPMEMAEALEACKVPTLKVLDLGENGLTEIRALVAPMASNALSTIEKLNLESNPIGNRGVMALATVLSCGAMPALQDLDLTDTDCGSDGCVALAEALGNGAAVALKDLSLGDNQIEKEGAMALAGAVSKGALQALETLVLETCGLEHEATGAIIEALAKKAPCLHSLNLNHNQMGQRGAARVAAALEAKPMMFLQELQMSGNGIDGQGFALLANAIGRGATPSLEELDLSNGLELMDDNKSHNRRWVAPNEASHSWKTVLFTALVQRTPLLTQLDLDNTNLGIDGARALMHALQSSKGFLHHLDLCSNGIDAEGAALIASAIGRGAMPTLRKLILAKNGIGDAGVEALCQALGSSTTPVLTALCLAVCDVGVGGAKALAKAMRQGRLQALADADLRLNEQVGDEGASALAEAIDAGAAPALRKLRLLECGVTELCEEKLTLLASRHPGLKLSMGASDSDDDDDSSDDDGKMSKLRDKLRKLVREESSLKLGDGRRSDARGRPGSRWKRWLPSCLRCGSCGRPSSPRDSEATDGDDGPSELDQKARGPEHQRGTSSVIMSAIV